ncbi:TniQ family protein [Streptomyces sp. NPDC045470]|uniref:TniQ family protein n=1 Tax=Streptomyces sp. NPDC045470 TaxID=3155469 RepID=UPI00340B9F28
MNQNTTAVRPLPRSLDPLDDETLVGFLLRLAHHNGTDPAQIATRMGLTETQGAAAGIASPWLLADMDKPRLVRAARAAHLTVAEADKLLLSPMGLRYGLVSRRYSPWTDPGQLGRPSRWVYLRTSQYCPPCLAGDDSPIQRLYGGAWKRIWRFPVVFACSQHQQLLQRTCPVCRAPAQSAQTGIIARPATPDLHPAQCRSAPTAASGSRRGSVCGADLPREHSPRKKEDATSLKVLLALQQRLDVLLSADGPSTVKSCGRLVPVAQYFIDLRIVASLILASWPEARSYAPTPVLAEAIGREAERRRRAVLRRKPTAGKKTPAPAPRTSLLAPLESPSTAGAVLAIAEQLLDARENRWTRIALEPIYLKAMEIGRHAVGDLARHPGRSAALQTALSIGGGPVDLRSEEEEICIRLGPRNG